MGQICGIIGPHLGARCGRIQPDNYDQPEGNYAWVFGCDDAGLYADLEVDDEVHISQTIDFTSLNTFTFGVRFRQGGDGSNLTFRLVVFIDGEERYWLQPSDGDTEEYVTRTINTTALTGNLSVVIKAEAVAP